jgi:hypothetical protein
LACDNPQGDPLVRQENLPACVRSESKYRMCFSRVGDS